MPLYTCGGVCSVSYSLLCSSTAGWKKQNLDSRSELLKYCITPRDPSSIMSAQIFSLMICLLLLTTTFPVVQSRRGGSFGRGGVSRGGAWGGDSAGRVGWGTGGGQPHYAPPSHTGGSSAGKVAGAAAAGALGGMLIGHGLSSLSQPGYGHGYGYGGYGGYGHGYGHGYGPRHYGGHGAGHLEEFRNETDMDYYMGAASAGPIYSCVLVFGSVMSLLLGHFLS